MMPLVNVTKSGIPCGHACEGLSWLRQLSWEDLITLGDVILWAKDLITIGDAILWAKDLITIGDAILWARRK